MPLIVFASSAGGVGCSATAAHCAHLFQQMGRPSLAIDFCMNNGLALALGLAEIPESGWTTSPPQREDSDSWQSAVLQAPNGLHLLPHGAPHAMHTTTVPTSLYQLLSTSDHVCVVDVGQNLATYAPDLLPLTDVLIVCTRAQAYAQQQLQHMLHELSKCESRPCTLRILANRYDVRRPSQKDALSQMMRTWPDSFLIDTIHEDEHLALSMAQGIPVHECYPQAQVAHDLHGVSHHLMKLLDTPDSKEACL